MIGGAPIDKEMTAFLPSTRLRVGYGQTEAAPGIALGAPGHFPAPQYIGRPLGCLVKQDTDGTLHFRGDNACAGIWTKESGFMPLPLDRFAATGDLVHIDVNGDYFFLGRTDDAFKLANGKRIEAGALETAIKAAFPSILEAMLFLAPNDALSLCLTTTDNQLFTPCDFAPVLGGLTSRLHILPPVLADFYVRTPKGSLDRARTQEKFIG